MPHYGIFGRTETGKSTLAKILSARIRRAIDANRSGNIRSIVVLNPVLDRWEHADSQFEDVTTAQSHLRKTTGAAVFVEETGLVMREQSGIDHVYKWTTLYRHLSHSFHFIGQRFVLLEPTLRDQMKGYFIFNVSFEDAAAFARLFGHSALKGANLQPNGEFFYATYSQIFKGRIDWESKSFSLKALPSNRS